MNEKFYTDGKEIAGVLYNEFHVVTIRKREPDEDKITYTTDFSNNVEETVKIKSARFEGEGFDGISEWDVSYKSQLSMIRVIVRDLVSKHRLMVETVKCHDNMIFNYDENLRGEFDIGVDYYMLYRYEEHITNRTKKYFPFVFDNLFEFIRFDSYNELCKYFKKI